MSSLFLYFTSSWVCTYAYLIINSFWPYDNIELESGSNVVQVKACCLSTPRRCLDQNLKIAGLKLHPIPQGQWVKLLQILFMSIMPFMAIRFDVCKITTCVFSLKNCSRCTHRTFKLNFHLLHVLHFWNKIKNVYNALSFKSTSRGRQSITYIGPHVWSFVLSKIYPRFSIGSFKRHIRQFLQHCSVSDLTWWSLTL